MEEKWLEKSELTDGRKEADFFYFILGMCVCGGERRDVNLQ